MGKATKATDDLGKATDDTAKKAKPGWKELGKFAANSAMVYGAGKFLKGSADATMDLAKGTMALSRSTGMDSKTSSEWVSVLKTRNIDTNQFNVGMVKLSKTMEAARGGNDKAAKSLAALGVTQDQITKGDVSGVLMKSADAFASMDNPAQKAATAQALFGKAGQKLMPILSGGSKGIQDQLNMANKYGAVLDDKAVGGTKNLIQQQRELQLAQTGVKVQLGSALLPVMVAFAGILQKVVAFGAPLLKNSTLLTTAIVLLTTAFIAYKVAMIASTIATLSFNAALLLIPLAIVAVVAGLIIAYQKVGWFRDAVNWLLDAVKNAFGWIKSHWPLLAAILAGPFGIAVLTIIRNFDKIKAGARKVVDSVRSIFGAIPRILKNIFSAAGGLAADFGKGIRDWLNNNTPFGDKIKVGPLHFTVPKLAQGGTVTRSGAALVGERGPEIVTLPRAAQVIPNDAIGAGAQTIVTQVFLDKRQIAEAVGIYASDRIARR